MAPPPARILSLSHIFADTRSAALLVLILSMIGSLFFPFANFVTLIFSSLYWHILFCPCLILHICSASPKLSQEVVWLYTPLSSRIAWSPSSLLAPVLHTRRLPWSWHPWPASPHQFCWWTNRQVCTADGAALTWRWSWVACTWSWLTASTTSIAKPIATRGWSGSLSELLRIR